MADMKKVYNDLIIINLYFLNYLLGGYPQQQSGYQPVATYPDNPPPYPGPPLENQAVAPPFAVAPPLTKSDYDRQPAYNTN